MKKRKLHLDKEVLMAVESSNPDGAGFTIPITICILTHIIVETIAQSIEFCGTGSDICPTQAQHDCTVGCPPPY